MRKWTIRLVGVVIVLCGAVYLVGALLPRNHTATVTRTIAATPQDVWIALTDVESYPEWRSDVDSVVVRGIAGGRRFWTEFSGKEYIPYAAETEAPPRLLVTRIDTTDLPYGGKWTTEIGESGEGSIVTITEAGEVGPPIFRLVSRFVIGHDATITAFLDALERRMASAGAGGGGG